jgi:hypothetical protein
MKNSTSMRAIVGCIIICIILVTGILPVQAAVNSSLDTAEESFFSTPTDTAGTSEEVNSSSDTFVDATQVATDNVATVVPSTSTTPDASGASASTGTSTGSNGDTTYNYYYYTSTPDITTGTTGTLDASADAYVESNATLNGTETTTSLSKPVLQVLIPQKMGVYVSLKKAVSGAEGYQVQVSSQKDFKKGTYQLRTKLTTKLVNVRSAGKKYVRVRAYKTVSGKTSYSKWSTVKTVKITK